MPRSFIQGVGLVNTSGIELRRDVDPSAVYDLNIVSKSENPATRVGYVYFDLPSLIPVGFYDVVLTLTGSNAGTVTGENSFFSKSFPQIATASPSSGIAGDTISLSGSGFVSGTSNFFFDTVEAESLASGWDQSYYDSAQINVPSLSSISGADSGKFSGILDGPLSLNIAVQNSATGTDSGIFATQFKLIGPPRITGFSSTTGFEGGPFNVLGNQFVNVTGVYFGKNSDFSSGNISNSTITENVITIPVPDFSFGKNIVKVFATGGNVVSSDEYEVFPNPIQISGFTPQSGFADQLVALSGSRISTITGVKINTQTGESNLSFGVDSSGRVQFRIPDNSLDTKITVCNKGGCTESSDTYFYLRPPYISGIVPSRGMVGDSVFLSGDYFGRVSPFFITNVDDPILVQADNIERIGNTGFRFDVPTGARTSPIVLTTKSDLSNSPMDVASDQLYSIEPKLIDAYSLNPVSPNTAILDIDVLVTSGINAFDATHIVASGENQFAAFEIIYSGSEQTELGKNIITGQPTGSNFPFVGTGNIGLFNVLAYEEDVLLFDDTLTASDDPESFIKTVMTGILTGNGRMDANRIFTNEVFDFVLPDPTIREIIPTFGKIGDEVNVFGTNLISVTGVTFSGLTSTGVSGATATSSSGNLHFSFNVPSLMTGTSLSGFVVSEGRGGQKATSSQHFEYEGLPKPQGISINFGRPGETFFISGVDIEFIDQIKFGDVKAEFGVSGVG